MPAVDNGFAIVTKDAEFGELSVLHGSPPNVVWTRRGNCSTQAIEAMLRRHHEAVTALEADTIHRAQKLIDAVVDTCETLEEQETDSETSLDAVRSCVASLQKSRTRFLNTVHTRLGLGVLSEETEGRIEAPAEQAFSPSHLPRPYLAAGGRLPQERR